jgi:hypothetical protein
VSEQLESQKYTGVFCHSCRQPIPVPQRMIDKARLFEIDDELGEHEMPTSILNLRCKACERENFYRISDVQDIPGTPISFSARRQSPYTLMRSQNRLSKAANT